MSCQRHAVTVVPSLNPAPLAIQGLTLQSENRELLNFYVPFYLLSESLSLQTSQPASLIEAAGKVQFRVHIIITRQ